MDSTPHSAPRVPHSARPVVGVEIGGTKLQAALGTRDGEIVRLKADRARPEAGAEGIRDQIEALVRDLLEEAACAADGFPVVEDGARRETHGQDARATTTPEAIGVGFGGPVDSELGAVLVSHQVEGWSDFPLRQWFEEQFGLPCRVENDSNAAGWAEFRCGAGRGSSNMVYMNIGSGIGGAIVIDGELFNGQGRGAGEIGHTCIPDLWDSFLNTESSNTLRYDKLEHLCSAWSIERRLRQVDSIPEGSPLDNLTDGWTDRITGPIIAEAAARGDRLVLDALDRASEMLGIAIANVITVLHPERFVIGGGFAQLGEPLFERLRATVDRLVFAPFRGRYEILPAQLEQNVVVAGALLLAPRTVQE